jgi:hypothetical protein
MYPCIPVKKFAPKSIIIKDSYVAARSAPRGDARVLSSLTLAARLRARSESRPRKSDDFRDDPETDRKADCQDHDSGKIGKERSAVRRDVSNEAARKRNVSEHFIF